jgi:hypothetical protein
MEDLYRPEAVTVSCVGLLVIVTLNAWSIMIGLRQKTL